MTKTMRHSTAGLILLLCSCTAAFTGEKGSDWPNWRGSKMDASARATGVLNFDHGEGLTVAWRKPLGSGYSSISIADGRAITMFSDSTNDFTIALDAQTGKEIWRHRIDVTYKGHDGSHDGPISTPLIAGGRVYALSTQGQFFALDAETGQALAMGKMQNSLDNLIGKSVAPLIGVFIHGVQGAGDEYQGDAKDKYSQMLAEELVPFIDENYRTQAAPETRANIGAAWAGFTSFYSTFKFPGVFGKVASQSAGIWTREVKELKARVREASAQPLEMYIDWGKYDFRSPLEGWDIGVESKRLADHFRSRGYTPLGGESPTGFGWASWRTRTDKILQAFFPIEQ